MFCYCVMEISNIQVYGSCGFSQFQNYAILFPASLWNVPGIKVEKNSTLKIICATLIEVEDNPQTTWLKNGVPISIYDFPTITLHPYL